MDFSQYTAYYSENRVSELLLVICDICWRNKAIRIMAYFSIVTLIFFLFVRLVNHIRPAKAYDACTRKVSSRRLEEGDQRGL